VFSRDFTDVSAPAKMFEVAAADTVLHQAGVIAYRDNHGKIEVLLITSRDTGRWIIPKGNIGGRTTPAKAAEKEAYEEALRLSRST
jgi:8-oxo-dGTP pyrophosphatase MutT (NUDIX family)